MRSGGLRDKWGKRWSYAKKLQFFLLVMISVVTVAAMAVSTVSSVSFLARQNEEYVSEQLSSMALEYNSTLEQYKAVALSLAMDRSVQDYCSFQEPSGGINAAAGIVYDMLTNNVLYMQNNANFIAVVNNKVGSFSYNGNRSMMESDFEHSWEKDYAQSIQAKKRGALRMSFAKNYYHNGEYTLTLYFPVYSVTNMVTETGMLVINLEDSLQEHLNNRTHYTLSSLYLTDTQGTIVSHTESGEIGRRVEFADQLTDKSGSFRFEGKLVNYQRVGDWNYLLVNEIPLFSLFQNCFTIIGLLFLLMLLVMGSSVSASSRMARALYRPMNKVICKMNDVSSGNLRTRINTEDMDLDSLKLADGFNAMMDEIDILMKQVAEEQRQIAQMRFNGLQSQIQPHFLYNTLECIHWQALADGSVEVSTMVKALAQYYRICLSAGKDIISLEKELEQVKNYLIIQNMRYGDIIELKIEVSEEYYGIQIPKITLQPLVENSIYHGIRIKEGRKGRILIGMREEDGALYLYVEDNGQGMSLEKVEYINRHITEFDKEIGYGINNVNKRIELLYGAGYGLFYSLSETGGVRAQIRLPRLEENPVRAEEERTDV